MKLRIKIPFVDKFTGERYAEGQEVEFTKARAEEIIARVPDYVERVEEPKTGKKTAKKKKEGA